MAAFDQNKIFVTENSDVDAMRSIAEGLEQEDPFALLEVKDIVWKYENFKRIMPRVELFYAAKCNDNITVLKVLSAMGAGFDCASKPEIAKILSLGLSPDRIIFANPTKFSSHISYAAKVGVEHMTFDNEQELYKIKQLFPTAKLVIRIRCDDRNAVRAFGAKFGCNPETEAPRLLQVAKSLDLNVVGISFHIGSRGSPQGFHSAIKTARGVYELAQMVGYDFEFLDLGGGFPGNKGTTIEHIGAGINGALDEFFPDPRIRVIAEPGRYVVASAFTLAYKIHSIREVRNVDDENAVDEMMYYLNDGLYGTFNVINNDRSYPTPKVLKDMPSSAPVFRSSLWGPTCDSADMVNESFELPKLQIHDWLYYDNMGAYTISAASTFNGFAKPKVYPIVSTQLWLQLKNKYPLSEEDFVFDNNRNVMKQSNGLKETDAQICWKKQHQKSLIGLTA